MSKFKSIEKQWTYEEEFTCDNYSIHAGIPWKGNSWVASTVNTNHRSKEEMLAIAKLISCAPELLYMVQELAENLELQLGRLGCCGEGDGKDRKGDCDSFGGSTLLIDAKELIKKATEL